MTKGDPAPNKGRKFPAETLSTAEVEALIAKCSAKAPTGIRNRALIAVMWRCGLRVSEALDLYPRDVELSDGRLRVRHGKGDKSRVVGLDTQTAALLGRWLDRRAALGIDSRRILFCSLDGKPVFATYVRELLKRLARKAGIEKRVHPHGLRHSFAVDLLRESVPVTVISAALGHSNVSTTHRYLAHLSPEEVVDAMRSRPSWGGGKK